MAKRPTSSKTTAAKTSAKREVNTSGMHWHGNRKWGAKEAHEFLDLFAVGVDHRTIATYERLPPADAIYRWASGRDMPYSEFQDDYYVAMQLRMDWFISEMLRASTEELQTTETIIERSGSDDKPRIKQIVKKMDNPRRTALYIKALEYRVEYYKYHLRERQDALRRAEIAAMTETTPNNNVERIYTVVYGTRLEE